LKWEATTAIMIQTNMLHTCSMSSCFCFKLDCIISRFKAKTEWSDFRFVKLFYIRHAWTKQKQPTHWMKMQIHSLPVGGAYGTAAIQRFLPKLFWRQSVAFRDTFIETPIQYLYFFLPIFRASRTASLLCLVQYFLCWCISSSLMCSNRLIKTRKPMFIVILQQLGVPNNAPDLKSL